MKSITLKKVLIENFKGIKRYEREFDSKENLIQAKFGSGKTTIKQSLNYVFGLKVENYRPYLVKDDVWVENEDAGTTNVEWVIEVDDTVIPMTYKFQIRDTGKTASYYIDDIKYASKKAYQNKLVEYLNLVSIEQLETLSNLDYFLNLKWQDQRELLKRITGVNEVLKEVQLKEEYALLNQQYFCKNVSELDIKKSLKQRRKTLEQNKSLNDNLINIDNQTINNYSNIYFDDVKKQIENIDNEIRKLDDTTKNAKISELKLKLSEARERHQKEIYNINISLNEINNERMSNLNFKTTWQDNIKVCNNDLNLLLSEQKELQEKVFNENINRLCPYCDSEISIEKLKKKFELKKDNDLIEIKDRIETLNKIVKENEININQLEDKESSLDAKTEKLVNQKNKLEEEFMIKADAIEIEIFELEQTNNVIAINDLKLKKDELIKQLAGEEILRQTKSHLENLLNQQIEIVKQEQELAILEELLNEYLEETQSIFTNHINSYFQEEVKWQFFSKLVSTGETTEDCILLCKGKRYDTACSTGERLMARVLVVQGLQKIVRVNFPIFVDDFNDLGIKFNSEQQLILLETKSNVELENIEKY